MVVGGGAVVVVAVVVVDVVEGVVETGDTVATSGRVSLRYNCTGCSLNIVFLRRF